MAFILRNFNPGEGTGMGKALKKSAPLKAINMTKEQMEDLITDLREDKKSKDKKKVEPGSYVKPGGKATGSMKDYPLHSEARRKEYDARGWKYDDTIKGYNRDGTKKEETKKEETKKEETKTEDTTKKEETKTEDKSTETVDPTIKTKKYKSGQIKKEKVIKDRELGAQKGSKVKYRKDGTVRKRKVTFKDGSKVKEKRTQVGGEEYGKVKAREKGKLFGAKQFYKTADVDGDGKKEKVEISRKEYRKAKKEARKERRQKRKANR